MSRQRFIHPKITQSKKVAKLSPDAQLMFVYGFAHGDDEGRRRADPELLKADLFPFRDDLNLGRIVELREELEHAGLIQVYGDGQYMSFPGWFDHQNPKYKKASEIPEPPEKTAPSPGQIVPEPAQTDPKKSNPIQNVPQGSNRGRGCSCGLGSDCNCGSGLEENAAEILELVREHLGDCQVSKKTFAREFKRRPDPTWAVASLLRTDQESPKQPSAFFTSLMRASESPHDDLMKQAAKILEPPVTPEAQQLAQKLSNPDPPEKSTEQRKNETLAALEGKS